MKFLVDTHLLIWSTINSTKLSRAARAILKDTGNECYFSSASIWEIAIKRCCHPKEMPVSAEEAQRLFLSAGYVELPVFSRHSALVEHLPAIHSDPFDRILVAQARSEGMHLATHDKIIPQYGDLVVHV
jgi:PIN domain nuclease of toxin-antitoxin system